MLRWTEMRDHQCATAIKYMFRHKIQCTRCLRTIHCEKIYPLPPRVSCLARTAGPRAWRGRREPGINHLKSLVVKTYLAYLISTLPGLSIGTSTSFRKARGRTLIALACDAGVGRPRCGAVARVRAPNLRCPNKNPVSRPFLD